MRSGPSCGPSPSHRSRAANADESGKQTMSGAEVLALPRRNEDPDLGTGSVFFVGTATVLIRYAGFTILTDPNFVHRHEQVDLGNGLHATRQTDPAVEIEDLPPLDLVVLSHFHGDHFD